MVLQSLTERITTPRFRAKQLSLILSIASNFTRNMIANSIDICFRKKDICTDFECILGFKGSLKQLNFTKNDTMTIVRPLK